MTQQHIARVFLRLSAVALVFGSIACANGPSAPTAAPTPPSAPAPGAVTNGWATPEVLARCLGGSGDAQCFTGARLHKASGPAAPITSAPVLNNNQPVLNSGLTVTLSWTAPGLAKSYIIEASLTPGGSDLLNSNTQNAETTLTVPAPPGVYYVRVRAVDASGVSAPSNEVQVVISGVGGSCPSAPLGLTVVSQSANNVSLRWSPPATGVPTSYVIQAGSAPGLSNVKILDTGNTNTTFDSGPVPAGSYYVRVYGRNTSTCAPPTFLGPASSEVLVSVPPPDWTGQIVCTLAISGPSNYRHNETQTWTISGPGQMFATNRFYYPIQWSAHGSGGGALGTWTINQTATTDLTLTVSAGVPTFNRTTEAILIRRGLAGTPTSYDLYEMDFPVIVGPSVGATTVSGTWSRPSAGGDAPVQPFGSTGTLACNWLLAFR